MSTDPSSADLTSRRDSIRTTSISPKSGSTLTIFRTRSAQRTLDELTLADILNGETCPPISFGDFASFVGNKEFSTENLLFVVWFGSYRERYEQMSAEVKAAVPIPSTRLGDRYSPFAYLDKAAQSDVGTGPASNLAVPSSTPRRIPSPTPSHDFKRCGWTEEGKDCSCGDPKHPHSKGMKRSSRLNPRGKQPAAKPILHHTSLHPPLPPAGTAFMEAAEQPMRDEARSAFATFLKEGGSRELGISDDLRQFTRLCLQRSTAPEVFLPVYEDVYQAVETQSLPNFLSYARDNINRPKQLFWYFVGVVDFLIGVIIFLILTLFLPNRHFGLRATRLPSTIFIFFGTAQFYSATRGFCNQVWGRSSAQVKPWELDDAVDEEASAEGLQGEPLKQTESMPSEYLFTPSADKDMEFDFPEEVHPLTDLSGTTKPDAWDPSIVPILEHEPEISEAARRQLAIRRATVKIPDASRTFPIAESPDPPTSSVPATTPPALDRRRRSEISPFDEPEPEPTPDLAPGPNETSQPSRLNDLSTLLIRFGRHSIHAPHEAQLQKVKVFGPERLVEDPRIKRLYKSIVRDIILVATAASIVWVVLCLTVPTAGLR